MGSTNSTKNASKLSAVKALAKSLIGAKKKGAPAKGTAPTKAASAPKAGAKAPAAKAPATKAPVAKAATKLSSTHKAPVKTSSKAPPIPMTKSSPQKALKKAATKASPPLVKTTVTAKAVAAITKEVTKARKGGGKSLLSRSSLDAEAVCREVACEGLSTTAGYCRLHYIKNWKKIKRKELILKEGKLNQYIEELVAKYPDKYIEAIRQDLASDKDFAKVIYDLDLDESVDDFDVEGESADALIDTIKRDFDDEGEGGF